MPCHITFDTLEYMDELKRSGMKQEEAEAITKATSKAFNQMMETKEVSTKLDLKELELRMIVKVAGMMVIQSGLILTVMGYLLNH